jgi:DNA polymerase III epsilon subunit-like protein
MPYEDSQRKQELDRVASIIRHWSPGFRARYGGELPEDYMTLDTETTGFDRERDVIVEWGHTIVQDRQVTDQLGLVINWLNHPIVPDHWVRHRLAEVKHNMSQQGRSFRITPEVMESEGVAPEKALRFIKQLITTALTNDRILVAHKGLLFDAEMIQANIEGFLSEPLFDEPPVPGGSCDEFPPDAIFDTGAVEKASQLVDNKRALPFANETMADYFNRIVHWKAPGIKWNLDQHCFDKYRLSEKYGLDRKNMHSAKEDAYALHLLFEEYRKIASRIQSSGGEGHTKGQETSSGYRAGDRYLQGPSSQDRPGTSQGSDRTGPSASSPDGESESTPKMGQTRPRSEDRRRRGQKVR